MQIQSHEENIQKRNTQSANNPPEGENTSNTEEKKNRNMQDKQDRRQPEPNTKGDKRPGNNGSRAETGRDKQLESGRATQHRRSKQGDRDANHHQRPNRGDA